MQRRTANALGQRHAGAGRTLQPCRYQSAAHHAPASAPMAPTAAAGQLQQPQHSTGTAAGPSHVQEHQYSQLGPSKGASSSKQPGRTTPQLLAKRAQRMRDAQALTHNLMTAQNWRELEEIYQRQRSSFNHIHLAALMTRLAKVTAAPNQQNPTPTSGPGTGRSTARRRKDGPLIKLFLGSVVPYIGMHLLSLGPRQLATVMWALGSVGYTPQPAWVVEWAACASRKLATFTTQDLCMSAWGLAASGSTALGVSSTAPGILLQICEAATQPGIACSLQPKDLANLLWSMASSGVRPQQHVLQALAGRAMHHLGMQQQQQQQVQVQGQGQTETQAVGWQQTTLGDTPSRIRAVGTGSENLQGGRATAVMDRPQHHCSNGGGNPGLGGKTQAVSQQGVQVGAPDQCMVPQLTHSAESLNTGGVRSRHAISQASSSSNSTFLSQELVTVVWSFAKLRYWPGEGLLSSTLNAFLSKTSGGSSVDAALHQPAALQGEALLYASQHSASGSLAAAAAAECNSPQGSAADVRQMCAQQVVSEPHHHSVMLWSLAKLRYRPPAAQVMHLLHNSLAGAAGNTASSGKRASVLGRRHTTLNTSDLAQIAWALGALRFAPAGVCRQQLLFGIHRALVATAQYGNVPMVDISSQLSLRTGMLSSRRCRRERWHPLRRANRASRAASDARAGVLHMGSTTMQPGTHIAKGESSMGAADQHPRRHHDQASGRHPHAISVGAKGAETTWAATGITAAAAAAAGPTRAAAGIGSRAAGAAAAPLHSLSPGITLPAAALVMDGIDESDALQIGELPLVLRGLYHIYNPNAGHTLPPPLVNATYAALSAATPQMHLLSPVRLLQLAATVARLRIVPPKHFTQEFIQQVSKFVHVLPVSQLTWLLVSLMWMRQPVPPRFLQSVMQRIVHLSTDNSLLMASRGSIQTPVGAQLQEGQSSRKQLAPVKHTGWHVAVSEAGPAPAAVAKWPGTPNELVLLLWALSRLGSTPMAGGWADVIVSSAGSVATALGPRQLARLVDAVRRLGLRPKIHLFKRVSRSLAANAAARAAVMRCDELCIIDDETGTIAQSSSPLDAHVPASHCRACGHLYSVPKLLRAWYRRLRLQQQRQWIRLSRQVKQPQYLRAKQRWSLSRQGA